MHFYQLENAVFFNLEIFCCNNKFLLTISAKNTLQLPNLRGTFFLLEHAHIMIDVCVASKKLIFLI